MNKMGIYVQTQLKRNIYILLFSYNYKMQLEGVVQDCVTYQGGLTSFKLESGPQRAVYFFMLPLSITNGQFVRAKTAIDELKIEDHSKVWIKQLEIYNKKNGNLLHTYSQGSFDQL